MSKIKFLASILILSFASCKDDDSNNPVITLSTPTDEQDYAIGDTIFIRGDVTDNNALHELQILLSKQETGEIVINSTPIVHALQSYQIDMFYVPTDIVHIHYNLKIEAVDQMNNKNLLEYTLHWND